MPNSNATVFEPDAQSEASLWQALGIPRRGQVLYKALADGFPSDVYANLADATGLGRQSLAGALNIAPATLQRRLNLGRFNKNESDGLYRLAEVFGSACQLFEGDTAAARHWLRQPVRGLGGARPIDMVGTSAQTDAVLDLIGRLEHGVFA